MAEWKVHRGFLDSDESGNASAQPQAPQSDRTGAPYDDGRPTDPRALDPRSADPRSVDPRMEDDPLVELARIVSESAANLGRLGTQPGDEPTLILGRATPKPLPLRPERPDAGAGSPSGFVSRATPTLAPGAPAAPRAPAFPTPSAPAGYGAPDVEPPTRGANPLTFEDDLLAELRQSVDPRTAQRPAPRADVPPSAAAPSTAASTPDAGRLAALRATQRPTGDEATARVAQVVRGAMPPQGRPPFDDDDGGPTIALNLRGGPRPGPASPAVSDAPAPLAGNPLEDGFDDLFADSADRGTAPVASPAPAATTAPKLTAGQPARDANAPRLGDNFPRPAVDPSGRGAAQRPKTTATKTRPVRPEPRRSGVGTGLFVAGSVLSVVVLAGLGYLGYRAYATNFATTDGGVPVIKAVGKVKEEPPARTAANETTAPRLSPDRVEDQTKLVTKSEEPVDQVSVGPRRITAGAPGTVVPQPAGDQPRTVKTVVVRPDGSVVQQATPAPTPTPVRTQPITPTETGPLVAVAPQPMPIPVAPAAKDPIGQQIAPSAPTPAVVPKPPVAPAPTATATPTPKLAPQPIAPPTAPQPTPTARPTGPTGAPLALAPQPLAPAAPAPVGQVQPRLAATPPAPAAVAAPSAAAGDFMVQLSSQKSEAEAQRAISSLQSRYGVLAGRSMDVQRADLGTKGVYYRVRVAGGSQEQAASLCGQIKSAGGDCMVTRR